MVWFSDSQKANARSCQVLARVQRLIKEFGGPQTRLQGFPPQQLSRKVIFLCSLHIEDYLECRITVWSIAGMRCLPPHDLQHSPNVSKQLLLYLMFLLVHLRNLQYFKEKEGVVIFPFFVASFLLF